MTDLSTLTHDQLAEHIRAGLLEAEARAVAAAWWTDAD